jgi:hypothetical protein
MTIELVKEVSKRGSTTYFVEIDGKYVSDSVRFDLPDAMELYREVKANHTKARKEVLIREEI